MKKKLYTTNNLLIFQVAEEKDLFRCRLQVGLPRRCSNERET
jgi:hypothetical protein